MPASLTDSPSKQANGRVFVVVPSFNHARFVEKCLRSIFKQTLAPARLLVIDDGSTDESPGIIERVLKDCPFPADFMIQENQGLCATLNGALEKSEGEYFAYLGSDDLWLPEFLANRVALLAARADAVLAYGNAYSIDESDVIIDCTADWAAYVDGDVQQMLMTTLAPLSPTVVYRRNVLERYGWNEDANLEDYELYLRLSGDGAFAFDPTVLSAWRVHGQNASFNLEMMLKEKLAAQLRVGPSLGFSNAEIKKFQSLARFRSAQEHMRRSEKKRALALMQGNLQGIQSFKEALRMLAGLLAPEQLLKRAKERRAAEANRRYGPISI